MDLRRLAQTFLRRWYFTALVLIGAVVVAGLAWNKIGAKYTSTASMVLIPPTSVVNAGTAQGSAYAAKNPLLFLSGLNEARDVIITSLYTDAMADEMDTQFGATFELYGQVGSTAPIMVASAEGTSPDSTQNGLRYLVDVVPQQLATLQQELGIVPEDTISIRTLAVDESPTVENKTQLEYSAAAFVLIVVVGALLIALLDSRRSRVRARRGQDPGASRADRRREERRRARRSSKKPADESPEPATTSEAGGSSPEGSSAEPGGSTQGRDSESRRSRSGAALS